MNRLAPAKAKHLYRLFSYGHGMRESARIAGVDRKTARRHHTAWLQHRPELQRAYDVLWEGDGDGCDAITAALPEPMVVAMLDAWLDDQFDQPLSGWHAGYEDPPHAPEAAAGENEDHEPGQIQGEPQVAERPDGQRLVETNL